MKFCRRLFPIIAMLLLISCSHYQDSSLCYDQKSVNEKAIVFSRSLLPHKYLFVFTTKLCASTAWERINPPSEDDSKKIRYWFESYDNIHMVLPGTYRLEAVNYCTGNVITSLKIKQNYNVTFTVSPREFVYIGDILVKDPGYSYSTILLEDAFEQARDLVKKDKPEITKSLEKRLLNGLKPGKLSDLMN